MPGAILRSLFQLDLKSEKGSSSCRWKVKSEVLVCFNIFPVLPCLESQSLTDTQSKGTHSAPFIFLPLLLKKGQLNDAGYIDTKLFPHSLPSWLMSNGSYIDLFVDLKEIQSQMPLVAFFPLWEIKRFNSACLSTLIIIISPFVFLLPLLPWSSPPLTIQHLFFFAHLLLANKVSRLFYKRALCHSHSNMRIAKCSLADNYQRKTRVLWGQNKAGWLSLM